MEKIYHTKIIPDYYLSEYFYYEIENNNVCLVIKSIWMHNYYDESFITIANTQRKELLLPYLYS